MTRLEEMKALATEEAIKLKEHATKDELEKLSVQTLFPNSPLKCVYGQMTGNCNSKRAQELIIKCAERVYNVEDHTGEDIPPLNGKPVQIGGAFSRMHYWQSPIEILIYEDTGGKEAREKLIAFLKDETQTLSL